MANSTPQVRHLVTNGSTKTSGGEYNLADGQFAIIDREVATAIDGRKAVTNFNGYPKRKKRFILTVGEKFVKGSRTSTHGHSQSIPFALEDVEEIIVSKPTRSTPLVDEIRLGWDGINPDTSFKFTQGMKPLNLTIELKGGSIPYSGGGQTSEIVSLVHDFNQYNAFNSCNEVDNCDPIACKPVIEDIVKRLNERQISGGRVLKDVVDIYGHYSCADSVGTTAVNTYQLEVCDAGDITAEGLVQSVTPNSFVKRVNRKGGVSVYETTIVGSIGSVTIPTSTGVLPVCSICPSGTSLVGGEFLYFVTINDENSDISGSVTFGNATKVGANGAVGLYSVVTTTLLNESGFQNAVGDLIAIAEGATLEFVGAIDEFCENNTPSTSVNWELVNTCYASTKDFTITLPDTECEENRLAELVEAYPEGVVSVATTNRGYVEVTLTGTSGTANINVDGVNYLATFATSLAVTASDFVTAHTAALATAGILVSSNGDTLRFSGLISAITGTTITNATTNLAGTVGAVVANQSVGGCMTTYNLVINTDPSCEGCNDSFRTYAGYETPLPFRGTQWELVVPTASVDLGCLCGITIKSKMFGFNPDRCFVGCVPYLEDSISIEASAGFSTTESITLGRSYEQPVAKKFISRKENRTHVAGNLIFREEEGSVYFQDRPFTKDILQANWYGNSTRFSDLSAQYMNIMIKVRHTKNSQHFHQNDNKLIIYNLYVEIGRDANVVNLINELAVGAGIPVISGY